MAITPSRTIGANATVICGVTRPDLDIVHYIGQCLLLAGKPVPYTKGLIITRRPNPHCAFQYVFLFIDEEKDRAVEAEAVSHRHRSKHHPE